MRKIFDIHCHIYPEKIAQKASHAIGDFYGIKMCFEGDFESLKKQVERAGTTLAAVHSAATLPKQVTAINEFISRSVKSDPERFIGFGTLHPLSENIEQEVEEIISLGLKGIKIHPDFQKFDLDSPAAMKMFEIVGDRLPFLIHMGDKRYTYSAPSKLKVVMKQFPKVRVIGAHLGGWTVWDEAVKELADTENLFVDCSSSLYFLSPKRAAEIIHIYTPERVFYGTDYPMWDLSEELERFDALPLSDGDKQKILWDNAQEYFGL